jgi:hypothetical protein
MTRNKPDHASMRRFELTNTSPALLGRVFHELGLNQERRCLIRGVLKHEYVMSDFYVS